jgi:hypothetical protein
MTRLHEQKYVFLLYVLCTMLHGCSDDSDEVSNFSLYQQPSPNAAFISGCEPIIPEGAGPSVLAQSFRGSFGSLDSEGSCQYEWPEPYLATCTEPLAQEAPDLRGLWADPETGYTERIEQCGNLVIIVGPRFTHGGYATGDPADGVNDYVATGTCDRPISVALSYEHNSLLFQVAGNTVVTRSLEVTQQGKDELVWRFGPGLPETARMRRYCNLSVVP